MKGQWKPYSNRIGQTTMYIAGRQLDMNQPLHSGNIEHHGDYTTDRESAHILCVKLNCQTEPEIKTITLHCKNCKSIDAIHSEHTEESYLKETTTCHKCHDKAIVESGLKMFNK